MIICVTRYLCIFYTYFYIICEELYAESIFAKHVLFPPAEAGMVSVAESPGLLEVNMHS